MSTLFQDEILKLGSGRTDSRSSTPFTYDSDCSGSGMDPAPTKPDSAPTRAQDYVPYYVQLSSTMQADSLVEWQYPPDTGDWYLLQEQVKDYLQARNFHRRYPDIHRHPIGAEERNHLFDMGILNEANSAFSFIGLLTEDVLDVMKEDYPVKYKILLSVLRKRELGRKVQSVMRDADDADEEDQTEKVDNCLRDILVDDAQSFNKRLKASRESKSSYTCSSTQMLYVPRNSQHIAPRSYTRRGRYPVAVLPGQYTDSVPEYTSERMYTLPLNTALMCSKAPVEKAPETVTSVPKNITVKCGQCSNDLGKSENVIKCNKCRYYYHTKCMSISKTMMKTVTRYAWDCSSCKTCSVCDSADGEESLMFCDICDRGYHTYCVNMSALPRGRWECRLCVMCACCNTNTPGDGSWRFQHNDHLKFLQTMCYPCSIYFDKGWFCPVCLKVFDYDAVDDPMVCCDFCDRWIHTGCDNIDDEHYTMLGESGSLYKCILCRGEKEEVYDKHHKKYKEGNKENQLVEKS